MPNHNLFIMSVLASLLGAYPAQAQPAQPPASTTFQKELTADALQFQARVDQAAHALENDPQLKNLTHEQRKNLVEFAAGNMLFAFTHELGHALVSEMGLPVLGKEEDAVDAFAVLSMLAIGDTVSDRVLNETATGWFMDAKRNIAEGTKVPFYDVHSIDKVRADDIVCLMVGSDRARFAAAATKAGLPPDRQASCFYDHDNAQWSWTTTLRAHLRPASHPAPKFAVTYGSGQGQYDALAKAFQNIGILELVSGLAADRYIWRRPISFEMKTCGVINAHWDPVHQVITLCYELGQDFADLYRGYGLTPPPVATAKTK
ncbi:MAG: DUF4344 domain-containing metallopeptidase [Alphaproteobacteria bacterium]